MLKRIALGLLSALALSACGGGSGNQVSIRVVHASPDAGPVDVYVNGTQVVGQADASGAKSPLVYSQATGFLKVDPGKTIVKVCAAGSATACPIDTTNSPLQLDSGKQYTIIAQGPAASLQAQVLQDDLTAPTQAGQFKLRVVHDAPAVAAVDVFVTDRTADLAKATVAIKGLTYRGVSAPYLAAPSNPSSMRIRVTANGTTAPALVDSGNTGLPLAAGKIYTAIVINPVGSDPTTGLILLSDN